MRIPNGLLPVRSPQVRCLSVYYFIKYKFAGQCWNDKQPVRQANRDRAIIKKADPGERAIGSGMLSQDADISCHRVY
jgi:hypothetical protein